jgi:hypothetical protein
MTRVTTRRKEGEKRKGGSEGERDAPERSSDNARGLPKPLRRLERTVLHRHLEAVWRSTFSIVCTRSGFSRRDLTEGKEKRTNENTSDCRKKYGVSSTVTEWHV